MVRFNLIYLSLIFILFVGFLSFLDNCKSSVRIEIPSYSLIGYTWQVNQVYSYKEHQEMQIPGEKTWTFFPSGGFSLNDNHLVVGTGKFSLEATEVTLDLDQLKEPVSFHIKDIGNQLVELRNDSVMLRLKRLKF